MKKTYLKGVGGFLLFYIIFSCVSLYFYVRSASNMCNILADYFPQGDGKVQYYKVQCLILSFFNLIQVTSLIFCRKKFSVDLTINFHIVAILVGWFNFIIFNDIFINIFHAQYSFNMFILLLSTLISICSILYFKKSIRVKNTYFSDEMTSDEKYVDEDTYSSIDKGDAETQFQMGLLYFNGQNVRQDYVMARRWFEKAAAQNHPESQKNLGVIYAQGYGVQQDYNIARQWWEQAAAQNHSGAQVYLGCLYANGHGIPRNYKLAKYWLTEAAAQGDATALYSLGVMYEHGLGVRQNFATAKELYGRACDNGLQNGCDAYARLNR